MTATRSEISRDSPVFRSGSPLHGNKSHVILHICLRSILLVADLQLARDDIVPIDDRVHTQRTRFYKKTQRDRKEPLVLDPAFAKDRIPSTSERQHELAKSDELRSVNVSYSTPGGLLCAQSSNYPKVDFSGPRRH